MQLHLVLVCVEVIDGVFGSIERFDLRHSKFCRKRELYHPSYERGFSLLYQVSIETGARPFTASSMWLSSCWMPLNLCSHDRSHISCWMSPSLLLSLPSLSSLRFSSRGLQGSCSLAWLVSPSPSASRGGLRCCYSWVILFWPSWACRVS